MKKTVTLSILIFLATSIYAGPNRGSFGAIYKNNKGSASVTTVKADDVKMIFFTVDVNPRIIKKYDLITVYATRPGVMKGWVTFDAKEIDTKGASKKIKGNRAMFLRVVNYSKNSDGRGAFYNSKYQQYLNGNLFLSKKGNNYTKSKSVNSYYLTAYVVGQKILRYKKKFINGKVKSVPVYSREQYIINPVKLKVITSGKIKAMKKSYVVKDKADFKLLPTN